MDASKKATLTEFANSLIARARVERVETAPNALDALPGDTSNEALHATLVAHHDLIDALTARLTAELRIVTAAMEHMEREIAMAKGTIARLVDLQATQKVEIQRALLDVRDLSETFVERLTENFERRLKTLA